MKKAQKRVAGIAVAAAAVVAAAFWLYAANNEDDIIQEAADTRLRVAAQSPEIGDITVTGEYIGTVDPDQMVTVYPKASGEILSVSVSVGDYVEAGDVLAQVDSKALRNTIAQSQAAIAAAEEKAQFGLQVAEKNLETQQYNVDNGYETSIMNAEANVRNAELGVSTAEHQLRVARRTLQEQYDKEVSYFVEGTGTYSSTIDAYRDAVTQAQIGVDQANVALDNARDALKALQVLAQEAEVTYGDQVRQAELNTNFADQYLAIQQLQDQLADYTVTASISGIIEQRNVNAYDMAGPSVPMFVISNKDVMAVSFNVAESALEYLSVGDAVTVEKNGTTYDGTITEISTMVDAYSGLFTVKASVETPSATMRSGSTLKVFVDVRKAEKDLLVPIDALFYESGTPYVFVVEDGTAKKVYVETGASDEENIQIIDGLTGAEQVITTWNSGLADGAEVVLAEAAE